VKVGGLRDKISGMVHANKNMVKRETMDEMLQALREELQTQHKRDMQQAHNDMQQLLEKYMQETQARNRAQTLELQDSVYAELVKQAADTLTETRQNKIWFAEKLEEERLWSLEQIRDVKSQILVSYTEIETIRMNADVVLAHQYSIDRTASETITTKRQIEFHEAMRNKQTEMMKALHAATQDLGHDSDNAKQHVLDVIDKKVAEMERKISERTEQTQEDNQEAMKSHVARAVGAMQLRCTEMEGKIEHAQIDEKARRTEEMRRDAEKARLAEEARSDVQRSESPRMQFPPAAHHRTEFSTRVLPEQKQGMAAGPTYSRNDSPHGFDRNHKSFCHPGGVPFNDAEFEKTMDQARAGRLQEDQQDALYRSHTPFVSAYASLESTASKRSSVRGIEVLATALNTSAQARYFLAQGGGIWDDPNAAGSPPAAGGSPVI